jgi:hypothetical protein
MRNIASFSFSIVFSITNVNSFVFYLIGKMILENCLFVSHLLICCALVQTTKRFILGNFISENRIFGSKKKKKVSCARFVSLLLAAARTLSKMRFSEDLFSSLPKPRFTSLQIPRSQNF